MHSATTNRGATAQAVASPLNDGGLRVLCAPASFKETLSARAAAQAMAAGVRSLGSEIAVDVCPVADGGEGSLDALIDAMGGRIERAVVTGPLGSPVSARFGLAAGGTIGIVELAETAGLGLVPLHRRDPTRTTTYGTGQLIRRAADLGCARVIVCVGGSATCDGGAGLAQALGAMFLDANGRPVRWPMTGEMLSLVRQVVPPRGLPAIDVACDVQSPLLGPEGAAALYGPQKGATPDQVRALEHGLANLAGLVDFDSRTPGAGAAGGAAFGLAALCGARLAPGIDLVLDAVGFAARSRRATLVLTGEGRLDRQTLQGKAVAGVAAAARRAGVPTIAIVGGTGAGAADCTDPSKGGYVCRIVSLTERYGEERAVAEAGTLLRQTAMAVVAEELERLAP